MTVSVIDGKTNSINLLTSVVRDHLIDTTKLSIIIYTNFSYLKSLTFGQLCVDKNLDT